MKTIKSNKSAGLPIRPEHSSTTDTSTDKTSTREQLPPLDFAKRQANRQLPTPQLLDLLRTQAPQFFGMAEVVGKWVWIHFTDKQPREITARLAEYGFHWNSKRQSWQHPCGEFRQRPLNGDPRERYGSQFPADSQAA